MRNDVMSEGEDRNKRELCQVIVAAAGVIILGIVTNEYFPKLAKILNYLNLVIVGIMAMPLVWTMGSLIKEKKSKKA